jgi:hypothetical protein
MLLRGGAPMTDRMKIDESMAQLRHEWFQLFEEIGRAKARGASIPDADITWNIIQEIAGVREGDAATDTKIDALRRAVRREMADLRDTAGSEVG